MAKIPAGMTKERFIEMEVQEAVIEDEGFDLLVMGRPEGPGCYCYVNNLLRNIIGKITSGYDFVVVDNAAGMEHISRRTMGNMNKLVLVSDYSVSGIRATKKIYDLAKELGIKIGSSGLIVNRVSGPMSAIAKEIKASSLALIGELPYDEEVVNWNISNKSVFKFNNRNIKEAIGNICEKLMKD